MSKRAFFGKTSMLIFSFLFMVVSIVLFIFSAHGNWKMLGEAVQLKRSSLINEEQDVGGARAQYDETGADETIVSNHPSDDANKNKANVKSNTSLETDSIDTKATAPSEIDDREKETVNNSKLCNEDKIYFSNEYYDCNGMLKGNGIGESDNNSTDAEKGLAVPTRSKQSVPKLQPKYNTTEKATSATDTETKTDELKNTNDSVTPRKIFVNCGGTFPWAVELFQDTYPNSTEYELFTFVSDRSYKIMYSLIPNHTFIAAEATFTNGTQNVDIKSFGSGSDVTQLKVQLDLATWLLNNTKVTDYVILRLESNEEIKVLERLTESKAISHVDKLYASSGIISNSDADQIRKLLPEKQTAVEIWDSHSYAYTDFDILNPKHIPTPGKSITMCQTADDEQKFALFLFSSCGSANAYKVLNFLQNFSSDNRLRATVFLPYQMLKSDKIDMKKLFETFHAGIYLNSDHLAEAVSKNETVDLQYKILKQKLTFSRRLWGRHGNMLQYILAGDNISNDTVNKIEEKLHYSIIQGGLDVTKLTKKALTGETVTIDDTGRSVGDFLLINIDKTNAEYLALYMLRRFAPWLLQLSECDVSMKSGVLNNTNAAAS